MRPKKELSLCYASSFIVLVVFFLRLVPLYLTNMIFVSRHWICHKLYTKYCNLCPFSFQERYKSHENNGFYSFNLNIKPPALHLFTSNSPEQITKTAQRSKIKWIYYKQCRLLRTFYPSYKKFYANYIRASMRNSMSGCQTLLTAAVKHAFNSFIGH